MTEQSQQSNTASQTDIKGCSSLPEKYKGEPVRLYGQDRQTPSQDEKQKLHESTHEHKTQAFFKLQGRLNESGVPARYRGVAVGHFEGHQLSACHLIRDAPAGSVMAMVGNRGAGKTQVAVELIRQACKTGTARYVRAFDLFALVKQTFDSNVMSERKVLEMYTRPSLLVIDELHDRKQSEWEDCVLTNIIDSRYGDLRTTIIISNERKKAFLASMGSSIASRLLDGKNVIECQDWSNQRAARE